MFSYSKRGIPSAFSRDARFGASKEAVADAKKEEAMKIVNRRYFRNCVFL